MLVPAFKLELNNAILKGMATVGKFDGRHPSLACATSGGKVFLHSAHATGGEGAVRFLSINRQITALAAGACARKVSAAAAAAADGDGDDGDGGDGVALDGDARPDALFVGSATNLLCYDVERNADLYFAEVPDGVNAMAHGTMPGLALGGGAGGGGMGGGMAIVGGNCSVQGFDAEGNEAFWTVTGGNVSAMAAHDVLGGVGGGGSGGGGGLLVGSDDFAIRSFVGEEVHAEVTETERVTELCSLWPPRHSGGGGGGGGSANSAAAASSSSFGYALGNGTVGVYNGSARAWRVKSKHRATALAALDVNGDGVPELISGWSNGKVEARAAGTGEVLFRDVMGSGGSAATPVSALACADYRLDGRQELLVCALDGAVRGFVPGDAAQQQAAAEGLAARQEDGALAALQQRKQGLLAELRGIEENLRFVKSGGGGGGGGGGAGGRAASPVGGAGGSATGVPAGTYLEMSVVVNQVKRCVELVLQTQQTTSGTEGAPSDTVIRAVAVFALDQGNVFAGGGESRVLFPAAPGPEARVPLVAQRDGPAELQIQAMVSGRGGSPGQWHVFELRHTLPHFAMYAPVAVPGWRQRRRLQPVGAPHPAYVEATLGGGGQLNRILLWATQRFHFGEEGPRLAAPEAEPAGPAGGELQQHGSSDHECVFLSFQSLRDDASLDIEVTPNGHGGFRLVIACASMGLAGDVLQDLCAYLQVPQLESVAEFPAALRATRSLLARVEEHSAIRARFTADLAHSSQTVKALVVQAEDARQLRDMATVRREYAELYNLNAELLGEFVKRRTNHEALLAALKQVNAMVQKASRLRVGEAKSRVVSGCRAAIKAGQVNTLLEIIRTGQAERRR